MLKFKQNTHAGIYNVMYVHNVTINIFVTKNTWMVLPQVAKQTPPIAETSVADLTPHGDQISSASNPP